MAVERLRVLNAPVDLLNMQQAVEAVCEQAKDHSRVHTVVAINPEKTFIMKENEEIRAFIEEADLVIPDGIGIVFGIKIIHGKKAERVPGADLMQSICAVSSERNLRIFVYGAKEDVNAGAVEKLRERYPGIQIVGRANGYLKPDQNSELVNSINASEADILFLALGSPKQERWVRDNAEKLNVGLCMGIGGTLDTIMGNVKRTPLLWQRYNAEWLYRFLRQPFRFWRSRRIFLFAGQVFWAKFRKFF